MNEWLTPVVEAYNKRHRHFSNTRYVWDVGSRDARDGVELADRIGGTESDVTAIEANPSQAKIIAENYPDVAVIETAVGNVRGQVSFTVYEGEQDFEATTKDEALTKAKAHIHAHAFGEVEVEEQTSKSQLAIISSEQYKAQ